MYEIYLTQRSPHADINKLPDVSKAVMIGMEKDRLIYSDTLPSEIYKISEGTLTFTDNAAGSLEITIPSCNNGYDILTPLLVEAKVTRDGEPIWYGRLLTVDEDLWKNKKCVFEGELSYLLDSLQTPQTYVTISEDADFNSYLRRVLSSIIAKHNGAVESYKNFKLGTVDIHIPWDNSKVEAFEITTNFENTLDVIKTNFLDSGLDVHIRLSHDNDDNRIIDFISGYEKHNASMQSINFGKNLLDYACNMDGSIYYTVIYPRGKQIEHQVDDKNAEYIPTLDTHVYEGVKYYERVLDYADPDAEHTSKDKKNTYRYKAVSSKENDNPYSKGWFLRYDYYRTTDEEVVKSNLKKYYTRSATTEYMYEPVEMISTDNPYKNGWYERRRNYRIESSDISDCYEYLKTKDTTVEYGKLYFKLNRGKLDRFIDEVPASYFLADTCEYLKPQYVGYYCRVREGFVVSRQGSVLLSMGTYVKGGQFFRIESRIDPTKHTPIYYFDYCGDLDYLNTEVYTQVIPNYDPKKYNPKENGWYTLRKVGRNVNDIAKDGRPYPEFIKGTYYCDKSNKTINAGNYGAPYFIRYQENIISFTEVQNPVSNANPYVNGWYELITDSKKNECVSLVGSKTGMRSGNQLYVDGQTGRMYNLKGMNTYGYIYNVVDFDDADHPEILMNKAIRYFGKFDFKQMTYELSALDLHYLNPSIKSLELLENIYCQSEPHGLNTDPNNVLYFPVTEVTIDLINPENTKYTLNGNTARSLTKSASSSDKNFSKYVEDTKIPSESTILEAARRHADDLIKKSASGSYAGFIYSQIGADDKLIPVDSDNPSLGTKATGIRVANGPTDSSSTGKWVWYSGGLGYYRRNSTNDGWSSPKVAITMDGSIVCDFLTTGCISLTGTGDKNDKKSYLKVYGDLNGKKDVEIGSWTKNGITINKGSIKIGMHIELDKDKKECWVPNFWADEDGNLYLKNGVYTGSLVGEIVDSTITNSTVSGGTVKNSTVSGGTVDGSTVKNSTVKGGTVDGSTVQNSTVKDYTLGAGTITDVLDGKGQGTIKDIILTGDNEGRFSRADIIDGTISGVFEGSVYIGKNKRWDKNKNPEQNGNGYNVVVDKEGNLFIGWDEDPNKKYWNFQVTKDGTMTANKGVFRGKLEAATGTFKGELKGASGIFKGKLEAAEGTFKGSIRLGKNDFGAAPKPKSTDPEIDDDIIDLTEQINYEESQLIQEDYIYEKAQKGGGNSWKKNILNDPNNAKNYKVFIGASTGICVGPPKTKKDKWKFRVTQDGAMTANDAIIKGTITGSRYVYIASKKKAKKYHPTSKELKKLDKDYKDKAIVLIDSGKILAQKAYIQFCDNIVNPDKKHLGFAADECSYFDKTDPDHEIGIIVKSRSLIEMAQYWENFCHEEGHDGLREHMRDLENLLAH